MQSKKYGIVLFLNKPTTDEAIRLSSDFKAKAGDDSITLGKKSAIPHITLFMVMLDRVGLVRTKQEIQRILDQEVVPRNGAPSFRRGDRSLRGQFIQLRGMGRALYWAQPAYSNQVLSRLHTQIVESCAPLISERVRPLKRLEGENLKNWRVYGYPLVMKKFHPHITLQWLSGDHAGGQYACPAWNWTSHRIALTEMDHRGVILSDKHEAIFNLGK